MTVLCYYDTLKWKSTAKISVLRHFENEFLCPELPRIWSNFKLFYLCNTKRLNVSTWNFPWRFISLVCWIHCTLKEQLCGVPGVPSYVVKFWWRHIKTSNSLAWQRLVTRLHFPQFPPPPMPALPQPLPLRSRFSWNLTKSCPVCLRKKSKDSRKSCLFVNWVCLPHTCCAFTEDGSQNCYYLRSRVISLFQLYCVWQHLL